MQVTIYAGSAGGSKPVFARAAGEFARELAHSGIDIVYGGGRAGLMGVVADAALGEGGQVTGIIPRSLMRAEICHPSLTALHVVASMSERKDMLVSLGDCYVALPGGLGTLEELSDVWSRLALGEHQKPVMVLNVDRYWDSLMATARHMRDAGFLAPRECDSLIPIECARDLLGVLATWRPPRPRWAGAAVSGGRVDQG
jgi:uncharacterized protein (TIGR00730 family)